MRDKEEITTVNVSVNLQTNKEKLPMTKKLCENTNLSTEGLKEKDRVLRVGIIGCGRIANAHIQAYLRCSGAVVVAGCDLVPGRAREFMDKYGLSEAKTDYRDHMEMLLDESLKLDAVSVCTYNRTHVECAKAALERGIGVLLEKPLCVEMEEAWELYDTVKRTGAILSVGFQPRFDENMKQLKNIVESGVLGKIYYVQTGGGRRHGIPIRDNGNSFIREETAGVGAVGDIGCYSLDMIMNALGHPRPLTVSGCVSAYFGKNPDYYFDRPDKEELAKIFSVEDFGGAFIRLEGDLVIDFRISWAMHPDTSGDTLIYGTKGALRIPSTECWNGSIGGPMVLYSQNDGGLLETVIPMVEKKTVGDASNWDGKIGGFLDAVRLGTVPPAPIDEIIYNQAIISGIVESARLKREVSLDFSHMDK